MSSTSVLFNTTEVNLGLLLLISPLISFMVIILTAHYFPLKLGPRDQLMTIWQPSVRRDRRVFPKQVDG